jgi:phosphoglycerol transferase MdoB-like AlkP superfamily enzyme
MELKIGCGSFSTMFILFCIFLVLKLCNVITWSWWWITAPLWAGIAVLLAFVLVCLVIFLSLWFGDKLKWKR